MAWCIVNSCHKVIRSIRNTTLKLWADCAKQFVRNVQSCGKTNHGFCTMTKHQLTHRCLGVSFWPKTKPLSWLRHHIHRLGPRWFFFFPKLKTPMKGKRFATIKELKEKSKQELLAIPKSAFQKRVQRIVGVWLWYWNQCPNISMGASRRAKTDKKHIKFGQMWRFCSLFSAIGMAWCIVNSCHKVIRSIRNTILELCANCAKQFVRNVQSCGKTNHGFCIMIKHQLTDQCLCVSFWLKTKP